MHFILWFDLLFLCHDYLRNEVKAKNWRLTNLSFFVSLYVRTWLKWIKWKEGKTGDDSSGSYYFGGTKQFLLSPGRPFLLSFLFFAYLPHRRMDGGAYVVASASWAKSLLKLLVFGGGGHNGFLTFPGFCISQNDARRKSRKEVKKPRITEILLAKQHRKYIYF